MLIFVQSFILFFSERESAVLLANTWLYHYYSVQSKIQFGMAYDQTLQQPAARPPEHSPTFHPQFYQTPSQLPVHGLNQHHPVYSSAHPHLHYGGYQSPHNNHHYHSHHQSNSNSPVLSQLNGRLLETDSVIGYNSTEKICSVDRRHEDRFGSPPPNKKQRMISRPEPLYIPEQFEASDGSITELQGRGDPSGHFQTLILGPVGYTSIRSRFLGKIELPPSQIDPTEFIDQWNPSPPWSETTQKVPEMSNYELSPYKTPPTPNSGSADTSSSSESFPRIIGMSLPSANGTAFPFDLVPEQFVPVIGDCPVSPSKDCESSLEHLKH